MVDCSRQDETGLEREKPYRQVCMWIMKCHTRQAERELFFFLACSCTK